MDVETSWPEAIVTIVTTVAFLVVMGSVLIGRWPGGRGGDE